MLKRVAVGIVAVAAAWCVGAGPTTKEAAAELITPNTVARILPLDQLPDENGEWGEFALKDAKKTIKSALEGRPVIVAIKMRGEPSNGGDCWTVGTEEREAKARRGTLGVRFVVRIYKEEEARKIKSGRTYRFKGVVASTEVGRGSSFGASFTYGIDVRIDEAGQ